MFLFSVPCAANTLRAVRSSPPRQADHGSEILVSRASHLGQDVFPTNFISVCWYRYQHIKLLLRRVMGKCFLVRDLIVTVAPLFMSVIKTRASEKMYL